MFFGDNRARPEQNFQEAKDENDNLIYKEKVNVLLGKNSEMSVGLMLTLGTVIVLLEPTYVSSLLYQIPRRVWRYGQKKPVTFYILEAPTKIENMMPDKVTKNSIHNSRHSLPGGGESNHAYART